MGNTGGWKMQDQYTGDVGDFGKYGLLRAITQPKITNTGGSEILSLGVVWYRRPNEQSKNDGSIINYLDTSKRDNLNNFRKCDCELYDCLAKIVRYDPCTKTAKGRRKISRIESNKILGTKTRFWGKTCPSGAPVAREKWHREALKKMKGCDLVFLDPDNGLKCDQQLDSGKHAYLTEVLDYVSQGHAVIFYHHPDRRKSPSPDKSSHDKQIEDLAKYLARKLDNNHHVSAFRYRRGTSRAFFIIWPAARNEVFKPRIQAVGNGLWSKANHFELTVPSVRGKKRTK